MAGPKIRLSPATVGSPATLACLLSLASLVSFGFPNAGGAIDRIGPEEIRNAGRADDPLPASAGGPPEAAGPGEARPRNRVLRVGTGAPFATVTEALGAARTGDTVRVGPGRYRGPFAIRRPVVLLGEGRPVLEGTGEGHVIHATAELVLRGFRVRNSGERVDTEDAGLMVEGATVRVRDVVFEDVLYGIYLKNAPGSWVADNRITGKPLPPPRRGDGIRLWYSSGTRVLGNRVHGTRDVVVYFSDSLRVAGNRVTGGRYGLHYMYSHHNVFENNHFEGNQVGAFIMFSEDVRLRANVFALSAGASGMGLGLKDADGIRAVDNLFVENEVGVHFDNSPRGRDARNLFRQNLLLRNGTALRMLPSVRDNRFEGNSFLGNRRLVVVPGGAAPDQAARNGWSGNYWSGYAGFDADGNGRGDRPFVHARLVDDLVARHPRLRFFEGSPVFPLVDALSRFFPLLKPAPVVVDSAPLLEPTALERWRKASGTEGGEEGG